MSVRTTSGERVADDPTNTTAGPSTPAAPDGEPLGIRAQLGATFEAAKRLLNAHIDLAKAEIADIAGNVARMVGLFAFAFVMALFAGFLFFLGGLLFLGEWLFGSIGWGALLGTFLLVDVALTAVLAALGVGGKRIAGAFGVAVLIGIAVGFVFGLDLMHKGWDLAGSLVPPLAGDPNRALNVAVITLGAIAGLAGLVMAWRASRGQRTRNRLIAILAGAIAGLLIGAFLGWLTATPIALQVGAAIGVLVALIAWPVLAGQDLKRTGIDGDALKKKFTPEATIELTKETIEWVRARTPLVPKS